MMRIFSATKQQQSFQIRKKKKKKLAWSEKGLTISSAVNGDFLPGGRFGTGSGPDELFLHSHFLSCARYSEFVCAFAKVFDKSVDSDIPLPLI